MDFLNRRYVHLSDVTEVDDGWLLGLNVRGPIGPYEWGRYQPRPIRQRGHAPRSVEATDLAGGDHAGDEESGHGTPRRAGEPSPPGSPTSHRPA